MEVLLILTYTSLHNFTDTNSPTKKPTCELLFFNFIIYLFILIDIKFEGHSFQTSARSVKEELQ